MLDVICWKWHVPGYRSMFEARHVNTLRDMVARNLRLPHRFSCITDNPKGIASDIRVIPLWDTYANIPNPSSSRNPSCYRRLKMFSKEAADIIGSNIVSMDLDVVITGDITSLFDHDHDFVVWGGQSVQPGTHRPYCWYNGSLMQLRAGTRTQVWENFNPRVSPMLAHRANARGSDQGWISYCLGQGEKTWGTEDGVYSYRNHVFKMGARLPPNARIVAFHGKHDPWMPEVQRVSPWIREHYR